ncbi:Excinuclease ABC subunit C [Chitinispirillum alkaliphilum]|nr:Excinuclease ABC subunit C [Chitinispirillum alkaliphilum]
MHEDIVDFLVSRPEGTPSRVISEIFLKFKNPDDSMADLAVKSILQKDPRCFKGKNGSWYAQKKTETKQQRVLQLPWVAVYLLTDPDPKSKRLHHIALWNLIPVPACLKSAWLTDPSVLKYDEKLSLVSPYDAPFDPDKESLCGQIKAELENKIVVFFSFRQMSLFTSFMSNYGESPLDNSFLLSHFYKVLNLPSCKPLDLNSCAQQILGAQNTSINSAYKQGELFASVISELINRIEENGMGTLDELDGNLNKGNTSLFRSKAFTANDISSLPEKPGVYGFKNAQGHYIYIGKAVNLKRRMLSYFRENDESPQKLLRLREDTHSFITHICGSELEALLYEYRLIRKYSPALNSQTQITERKGDYKELGDCIVLLPGVRKNKGMSFWFRNGQKIKIVPFETDFSEYDSLKTLLEEFFFSEKLSAESTDFPELEIAFRWIKKKQDFLTIVPVSRYAGSDEIVNAMKSYWGDFAERYQCLDKQ